jgi:nucleoid DNA-binding protein/nucleoid-associated protein YgaU
MSDKIYERQLVERLVQIGGAEPVLMRDFLRETLSLVEEGLLRDGVVRIHNFGTFRLRWTDRREGINPRTGEKMMISGRARVVFQPVKGLRELVNLNYRPSTPALAKETAAPVALPMAKPVVPKSPPMVPARVEPLIEEPVQEEIEVGEMFTETASDKTPTFVFAETVEAPKPAFLLTKYERDRLGYASPRPRSRRFAWFAGSLAVLLLLLLVFVGRISDKQARTSHPVAGTAPPSTPAQTPIAESPSAADGINPTTNGRTQLANGATKPSTKSAPFFVGGTHQVVAGDNLWNLSGNYYRDHYLWPNIYRANKASINDPDILEIEQQLDLPVLYGPPENLTPADRRNLAEGYFLLYRYYKRTEPHLAPYALWAAVRYDFRVKTEYAAELSEDDLAFLSAHGVRRAMAER